MYSIFSLAKLLNGYFIVALLLFDVFATRVLGFVPAHALSETLRLFGVCTLIISSIHATVAASYPKPMLERYSLTQGVYYAVCAATLWLVLPHTLMVTMHCIIIAVCSILMFLVWIAPGWAGQLPSVAAQSIGAKRKTKKE